MYDKMYRKIKDAKIKRINSHTSLFDFLSILIFQVDRVFSSGRGKMLYVCILKKRRRRRREKAKEEEDRGKRRRENERCRANNINGEETKEGKRLGRD